jgi:hypothetical protein
MMEIAQILKGTIAARTKSTQVRIVSSKLQKQNHQKTNHVTHGPVVSTTFANCASKALNVAEATGSCAT